MCNAFRRSRPAVRLVSLVLAMALVMAAVPFLSAGAERDETDHSDMAFAHWGMSVPASNQGGK